MECIIIFSTPNTHTFLYALQFFKQQIEAENKRFFLHFSSLSCVKWPCLCACCGLKPSKLNCFTDIIDFVFVLADPALVLSALVGLFFSAQGKLQLSASSTLMALLINHRQKPEVVCMLLDCLRYLDIIINFFISYS